MIKWGGRKGEKGEKNRREDIPMKMTSNLPSFSLYELRASRPFVAVTWSSFNFRIVAMRSLRLISLSSTSKTRSPSSCCIVTVGGTGSEIVGGAVGGVTGGGITGSAATSSTLGGSGADVTSGGGVIEGAFSFRGTRGGGLKVAKSCVADMGEWLPASSGVGSSRDGDTTCASIPGPLR